MIRTLFRTIAASLLLSSSSDASSINVSIKCHSGPNCDARGAVVLQSVADQTVARRVNLSAPSLVITEQAGSEWEMSLDAKGFWALPQRIVLPKGDVQAQYAMAVWRTGTLQGQLKFPDPQPAAPVAVKVVISSRPDPRVAPEIPGGTSFDCSIEKSGQWACALPAALLDVAVSVEGYAPYHKWDVKIPVAGVINLGTVALQKGGSAVAWLDSDFVRRVEVPVRALLRYEAVPGSSATAMRLALPVAEGVFTKKGVVQLAPIAPGRYILEVQAKGYAPARVPMQLYAGRETTPRRSIELQPALSVRLLLQPPLGPGGIPWQVELWRRTDSGSGSQDAGRGTASREGVFTATDQAEGPLHVYLKDSKQNILVHGYAFLGGSARQEQATTDLQGGFTVEVPSSATEAIIIVAAPGRTLESFSVPTTQDDPVALDLASRGGTLRLRWTAGALPLQFAFNDHLLVSTDVFLWARGQRARIDDGDGEIPNVAPGKYRFCSVSHCAEGLLAIGGQLELDATH